MSIATEITRLQTAKADLKTAIESKGVTVSASATLDAYADLVDAIETGGGGGGETLPGMMSTSEVITIGANSITNASDAKTYFDSYNLANGFLYLVESPTVNNQLCMVLTNQTSKRWRSNTFTPNMAWGDSAYDCKLVEGTHYVLWSKS